MAMAVYIVYSLVYFGLTVFRYRALNDLIKNEIHGYYINLLEVVILASYT